MASTTGDRADEPVTEEFEDLLKRAFITGAAITIPAIVTLIVLQFALGFVAGALRPVADAVNILLPGAEVPTVLLQLSAALVLLGIILVVGLVADQTSGSHGAKRFHHVMEAIPGLGSIYTSFQKMSELLLESDTDSFQEVKLVEYPSEGSYAIAFLTADTPDTIQTATDHEDMVTLYVPLAPNPVMGGFVVHVSEDQVFDVDMSVEAGIRSIVTSGVAMGEPEEGQHPDASGGHGTGVGTTLDAGTGDRRTSTRDGGGP